MAAKKPLTPKDLAFTAKGFLKDASIATAFMDTVYVWAEGDKIAFGSFDKQAFQYIVRTEDPQNVFTNFLTSSKAYFKLSWTDPVFKALKACTKTLMLDYVSTDDYFSFIFQDKETGNEMTYTIGTKLSKEEIAKIERDKFEQRETIPGDIVREHLLLYKKDGKKFLEIPKVILEKYEGGDIGFSYTVKNAGITNIQISSCELSYKTKFGTTNIYFYTVI